MPVSEHSQRRLNRRVMLLGGIKAAAFLGLAGRMGYLQFVHADTYSMLSEENRIKIQILPPQRGMLLDRNGEPIAENEINYRLFLERESMDSARESVRLLCRHLAWPPEERERLLEKVGQSRRGVPLLLAENMLWEEVVKTQFYLPDLPGLYLEEGQRRAYPLAALASHLVGYVGRVAEEDVEQTTALHRLPEFKIGKSGIELLYEDRLRGEAGTRQLEVNARGVSVRELAHRPFEPGENLTLTIDAALQRYAAERLGEESGSIIVMDANRGDLLACVSMPSFDPNEFSAGISQRYWKELMENERKPLLNKAISGVYPPASTFKMIVGLAGLKAGVVNEKSRFYCPGHYVLGNRRFNCWKPGGHGFMDLNHAIAESCDTYFYEVGARVGIDAITEMAARFGFGETSGLGLVGEKSGLLPSDEWKRKRFQTPWVKGDTINASIGQGFMLTTPMQLAIMTARMVSGKQISPRLLAPNEPLEIPPLEVDTAHLQSVLLGMYHVNNAPYGTAYWKRIEEESMKMGGKTGTAQVKRILRRGIDQASLPWKHRHHGLFVGYAPTHNPNFVVSVVVDHGGGGSAAAAPIARDVLIKAQELAAANPKRFPS